MDEATQRRIAFLHAKAKGKLNARLRKTVPFDAVEPLPHLAPRGKMGTLPMTYNEFCGEEEPLIIVPNFKHPVICLISGDVGPYNPGVEVEVPTWLGLEFYRKSMCRIRLPQWIRELARAIKNQRYRKDFTELHTEHWREVHKMLQSQVDIVVPSCQLLIERREAILRLSVHQLFLLAKEQDINSIFDDKHHVVFKNMSQMEIYTCKRMVQKAWAQFQRLRFVAERRKAEDLQEQGLFDDEN